MNWIKSKVVAMGMIFFLAFVLELPAMAAEYPNKPITLMITHPAGGALDLTARPLAAAARKYLGQTIICENYSGGGGAVGYTIMAAKPADGYALGVIARGVYVNWHLGSLTVHPVNEATHIITYGGLLNGIAVRADARWKTIQEFIEYSRQNPGKVSYGSTGVGTIAHIRMEDLAIQAGGIQWVHIPQKGDAGCMPALLGGHVDSLSSTSGSWAALTEAGKFRLLAIYPNQRSTRFPKVPTLREAGYDVADAVAIEIIAPKGIPKAYVQKLHDAFKKAMEDSSFQEALKKLDLLQLYYNSEDSEKFARQDFERYEKIVQRLGLQQKPQ